LSTPPWDKNKVASEFETVIKPDGTNWQIMKKNYVYTPEGTVYVYDPDAAEPSGTSPSLSKQW
jgi:hypothetical protein